MPAQHIPRWLFGGGAEASEAFVIHTQSPRFIALLQDFAGASGQSIPVDGGWFAVPVEWIDPFDRSTFNIEEMQTSLNSAFEQSERDREAAPRPGF